MFSAAANIACHFRHTPLKAHQVISVKKAFSDKGFTDFTASINLGTLVASKLD